MQMKHHHASAALGLLILLVSVFLTAGCATTMETQREPLASVGVIEAPTEVAPAAPPFQASQMLGLLDITEPEQAAEHVLSGFAEAGTPSATDTGGAAEAAMEAAPVLEVVPQAVGVPVAQPDSPPPVPLQTRPADFVQGPAVPPAPIRPEKTITAVGSGLSEADAKKDALSALSGILYSQVASSTESRDRVVEVDGKVVVTEASLAQNIVVSTNLPILGASYSAVPRTTYDVSRKATIYQIDAVLRSSSSRPLYEGELKTIGSQIASAEALLAQAGDSLAREQQLSLLLGYYIQHEKLSYVARALGSSDIPVLNRSRYSIEAQLKDLGRVIDSYTKAAQNLTTGVVQNKVYVYPAKLNASGGVTEFAEQLSYAMRDALGGQSVSDPQRASYFLIGTYTLKDDGRSGIYVTYRLEDRYGNVSSTSMAELLPTVYEGQRFIPVAYDFQKQLERGDSIDTDFSVDIRINGMKDYLAFKRGDDLTIEVRSSAPCYLYVVGYVFNDQGERFSYLFPLKLDAMGKDMFVYRVSPEDVNKWIIINPTYGGRILPIQVIEPYGVEMLQVYASTDKDYQRFLDTVPGFRETKDYYVVSDNPEDGLRLTRTLNIKQVADQVADEIQRSEASVSFKSGR